jgi:hypothetical protein
MRAARLQVEDREVRAVALAALILLALGACGGADPEPTREAVGATRAAGTARMWSRHAVVYPGEAPKTLATGRGVVDFRTGRGASRWSVPFLGALLGARKPNTRPVFDVVYTPRATYLRRSPADRWTRARRNDPMDSAVPDDPTEGFAFLSGESRRVLELGREVVRGALTGHYRVELEAAPIAERSSAAVRRAIEEDGRRLVPVEVWIDGEGLIRRLRWDNRFQIGDTAARIVVTTEYFDFGADVAIAVPRPEQVGG